MDRPDSPPYAARLLPALMFVSGGAALVYEIIWSKHLALTFGADIRAISIVAAVFMSGLAAGSYLFGKVADRSHNLLRLYGLLEIGIAASALAFAPALSMVQKSFFALAGLAPGNSFYTGFLQLLLTAVLLLLPTICMGGTIPVACRCFARAGLSRWSGRLYGWNTAGAALGCLGAAFALMPYLGLTESVWLAAGGNIAAALLALAIARPQSRQDPAPQVSAQEAIPVSRGLLAGIALAGACAMALEILWTRVFLLFFGTTIYTFAIILGCYLISLAIGGALYARRLHRIRDRRNLFISLLLLMGAAVLITVPFYDQLAFVVLHIHRVGGDSWWILSLLSAGTVFAVIGLPTLLSGALFPTAVGATHPDSRVAGRSVGVLLLFNTVGAMAGSLAACFLLLPKLGMLPSFRLLGAVLAITALIGFFLTRRPLRPPFSWAFQLVFILIVSAAAIPHKWDQKIMNSGVYIYAPRILEEGGLRSYLGQTRLLFTEEGVEANVAVSQARDGSRSLLINGKADANSASDMPTQVLLGQLPLLLHPKPKNVLVIGLGSGVSAGAAGSHPVRLLHSVELSPAVIRAASFFSAESRNILEDPRFEIFRGDGRSFLATHDRQYDVIISEPSNPWQSGNANLFTAEFYRLAASQMTEDGLLCQWLPTYDLGLPNLRSAVATFLDTYPYAQAFYVYGDLILVGSQSPITVANLQQTKFDADGNISQSLQEAGIHSPQEILRTHYLFDQQGLRIFAADSPLNTDHRPKLEFAARELNYLSNRSEQSGQEALKVLRSIHQAFPPQ